ncbi:MAG TPA: cytochrome c3 family protein [Polyangiaceae bacterium]|nr:cytochrome c3 family protein [Polyangiaceae bacterium]
MLGACYGGQAPSRQPQAAPAPAALGKRARDVPDDCVQQPGQPAPEPLRIPYQGVARAARCQREVYTIMGGITHFLDVECKHCHLEPDYSADTHNKQIANWMARELIPRLELREQAEGRGGDTGVWCQDCHAGKPKFLGNPRRRDLAIEWMTTHLVEDFETTQGKPPKCKDCHGGDLGSPGFRAKIILTDLPFSRPPLPTPSLSPTPTLAPGSTPAPEPASGEPVPD